MQIKKHIHFIFAGCIALTMSLSSCRPDEIKEYTAVNNGNATDLVGIWNGVSVNQRDVGAENKNFPYKNQDITAALQFNSVKLTLNGTTSGTFSINYGSAPPFFKFNSGNWSVDNASKVGIVYLVNGTDSIVLNMGSYNYLLQNKLQLKQTKTLLGKAAIVYEFLFSK
jgi:hypothetical protein